MCFIILGISRLLYYNEFKIAKTYNDAETVGQGEKGVTGSRDF